MNNFNFEKFIEPYNERLEWSGKSRLLYYEYVINKLVNLNRPILIVETGTMWSKLEDNMGAFTLVFGDLISNWTGGKLITIDISEENIEKCREVTKDFSNSIEYIVSDSVKYLELLDDETVKDINKFVQNIAKTYDTAPVRIKEFRKIFDPYFKILQKGVKDESLGVIFSTDSFPKYSSSVIAPLGYWLVGYMNSLPSFISVLNNVSQSLKTEQIYLNLTPSSLVFTKKVFKEAEFKFEYGGNAKNADNTGIKFSMK